MKKRKGFPSLHNYALSAFFVCLVLTVFSGYATAWHTPKKESPEQKQNTIPFFANEVQNRKQEVSHLSKELLQSRKESAQNSANVLHFITTTLRTSKHALLLSVPEGTSVYEMMKIASNMHKFSFNGKNFGNGLGFFVQEIDGIKEDLEKGKYWIYYLNGKKASLGVSNVLLHQSDAIEWRYEDSE